MQTFFHYKPPSLLGNQGSPAGMFKDAYSMSKLVTAFSRRYFRQIRVSPRYLEFIEI